MNFWYGCRIGCLALACLDGAWWTKLSCRSLLGCFEKKIHRIFHQRQTRTCCEPAIIAVDRREHPSIDWLSGCGLRCGLCNVLISRWPEHAGAMAETEIRGISSATLPDRSLSDLLLLPCVNFVAEPPNSKQATTPHLGPTPSPTGRKLHANRSRHSRLPSASPPGRPIRA